MRSLAVLLMCAALLRAADPIAQLAAAAPPEFAADALLRLVESRRVTDTKQVRELLQQAFELAGQAKFRGMRKPVSVGADTREGSLVSAHALKLDAISLQARAIGAMARLDGPQSREMFVSAVRPEVPEHSCQHLLTYDFLDYYQSLTVVVGQGFSAKERAKEDHVSFLLDAVSQVQSAAQIAPLEQAISASGLTPVQRDLVMVRLDGRKLALPAAAGCEKPSEPSPYWKSETARTLMSKVLNLRTQPDSWLEQVPDLEKSIAGWEAGSEPSPIDYYQQKCIVYQALVELIPAGVERDKALDAFVNFISHSDVQRENPVEWYMPAQVMLDRVRNSNDGEPGKVLDAFEASGNPILVLRAAIERTFHNGQPSWVSAAIAR